MSFASSERVVERLERGVADAARRDVDHPLDRRRVVRPHGQAEVRQDVLDLGALVELHAADDGVRDVRAQQLFFKRPRLRVRPEEHRDLGQL